MFFSRKYPLLSTILLILCFLLSPQRLGAQLSGHSLLSEGDWWRVRIDSDGIYRLSGGDISGMAGCSISDIIMCGSEGGPLNTVNGEPRPYDLEEIAVEVHDEDGDEVFDENDYVLFYATGADSWKYDDENGRFYHIHHPYATANYVYISHRAGNHLRIASSETLSSTGSVKTSAHCTKLHHLDKVNTHRSGEIWVGEKFTSSSREQTITIPLSSMRNGQASVRYALAAISTATSAFNVNIGGQSQSHSFSGYRSYNINTVTLPASSSSTINVNLQFTPGETMATGYLDFIEVDAEVELRGDNGAEIYGIYPTGGTETYRVAATTNSTKVWDVTKYNEVRQQPTVNDGNGLTFTVRKDTARRFYVFTIGEAKQPSSIERIANQDIHGAVLPDMVIVYNSQLKSSAERLASIHSIHDNMEVLAISQDEVFNEFSSGKKDPTAIREMLRHFRQRATDEGGRMVSHLLLFGKGTYDNKNILGSELTTVITYQSTTSFDDEGTSMTTDDIFAYLEDGEGLSVGTTMDVAIGRLPAKDIDEANHLVDKIERYITKADLSQSDMRGDWRNSIGLLADDADPSCVSDTNFTTSSEYVAHNIMSKLPQMNIDKIYADAYIQQSGADGSFYPDVNNTLKKRMDYGCLLLNYIGHGSSQYIGTERFMTKQDISSYQNRDRLPYFVTSTCTFGRHDDPNETCGAEEFVLAEGGGIACLAATRPISHIQSVNNDMVIYALDANNTIGEAVRKAKNRRYTTQSLTLIGDPAIRLSIPTNKAVITKINGKEVDAALYDTALVLSTVTVEGEIRNADGAIVSDFDGDIYPEVYDREREAHTLANDNEGCEIAFSQQNSLIYRGHTTVKDGHFAFHFTVPRDVPYRFELARISLYAKSAIEDASGAYTNLMLGGFDKTVDIREVRPDLRLYLNDTNFRNGGITDANPTLLVMLHDSVGINAVGSGLGHDMTAVIDGNSNNTIILNDLYETDITDEQRGMVKYNLNGLSKGRHTISVRVWNIFNYSSNADLTFYVQDDSTRTDFVAYPIPAKNHVQLTMEHNIKGNIKSASLYIYDMQGRLVRSFTPTISDNSYVVGPVDWNLTTGAGVRVSPGIYIGRFELTTNDGEKIREQGKVVVN